MPYIYQKILKNIFFDIVDSLKIYTFTIKITPITMMVIVNGKKIEIFDGATAEHAIRKFAPATLKAVKRGLLYVTDSFGNTVALDGNLTDNEVLHIQPVSK